jgi:hypothetical protein
MEDQADVLNKILDRLNEMSVALATLKVKAGIWGAVAGAVPFVVGLLLWAITKL